MLISLFPTNAVWFIGKPLKERTQRRHSVPSLRQGSPDMLKVWLLVTAGVLRLVFSAPAALPDRLPPLYICLTPPSDRLAPPSASLAPLMERLSRHLARGPAGPSDGQQQRFISSIEADGPGQQQQHLDQQQLGQQQQQLSQRQLNMQQANQQLLGVDLTPQSGPQRLPARHRGKREVGASDDLEKAI